MEPQIIRAVDPRDAIREDLIWALEAALVRAKEGHIEGFSVVILSDKVETFSDFPDRLKLLGALQMAICRIAETVDPL